MEAIEKQEKVGEGTYGKVYRVREKTTSKIVALKKTRLIEVEESFPPTTLCEISLLRMLSRDDLVRLNLEGWCWKTHNLIWDELEGLVDMFSVQCFNYSCIQVLTAEPISELKLSSNILQDSIINEINTHPHAGWVAAKNDKFNDYTVKEFKCIIGSKPTPESVKKNTPSKTS